ncbi:hypothetical protein BD311DRAFT_769287 [Dichomitus squalens]|uniref:Uncharacterized protein n=1 Tax=Dichomitus squalens TaxID=114155 RepID=A0A4Q9M7H9_9APHY|nr:hypothetical protein BD311DRAFT_769287 [Dichomitus squalens]
MRAWCDGDGIWREGRVDVAYRPSQYHSVQTAPGKMGARTRIRTFPPSSVTDAPKSRVSSRATSVSL